MQKRREKIEQGLEDAKSAHSELERADEMVAGRITEADRDAVAIIQKAEKTAQEKSAGIVKTAEQKAEEVMLEAKRVAEQREQEEFKRFAAGAGSLLRQALAKAVAEDPQKIDEKLVGDAVAFIKKRHVS
ncbi:MAG: ATP synthase subunit b [Parcubacteria group bacterium GW2011_GWA2_47_10b]|nr:MAG: ATP synthase subunit b [Parcubacteria group bacterium GW2011_GWA2_47_10b]